MNMSDNDKFAGNIKKAMQDSNLRLLTCVSIVIMR
jgi:hypothetical protein